MLGISRQTLENWAKYGVLNIISVGKNKKSHWVYLHEVEAIRDKSIDVVTSLANIEKMSLQNKAFEEEVRERQMSIRKELFLTKQFGRNCVAKEFYTSFVETLGFLGVLVPREEGIMRDIIYGREICDIAYMYGVSANRVMQVFSRACRRAKDLGGEKIKRIYAENEDLKNENETLRQYVNALKEEIETLERTCGAKKSEIFDEKSEEERTELENLVVLLRTPIVQCDLTVRALNCLKCANIETIGDLCAKSELDLMKQRNFGKKSLVELEDFLDSLNLTFNMNVGEIYKKAGILKMKQIEDNKV